MLLLYYKKQWRNKVRSQQYEREKELSDHAVVIKELQKVIGNERIAKEQLENQVCKAIFNFFAIFVIVAAKLNSTRLVCSRCIVKKLHCIDIAEIQLSLKYQ